MRIALVIVVILGAIAATLLALATPFAGNDARPRLLPGADAPAVALRREAAGV
jgi:hypothetical protein